MCHQVSAIGIKKFEHCFGSALLFAGCSYFDFDGHLRPDKDPDVNIFMTSTIDLDLETDNVTLPIFKGQHDGKTVWYIVTESSDEENAEKLGVNFAPKLANALGTEAVQDVKFIIGLPI